MLNIYYGRENTNKEAFAFREIKTALRESEVLVLVPDQFKLMTEMAAMEYMNVPGLMGLEVMSLRRLGDLILTESGDKNREYIDKYGRHIILSDIMESKKSELHVYHRQGRRTSFLEMINNLISELKRFGITVDVLKDIIAQRESGKSSGQLLTAKLKDILVIYEAYEERIAGKYVDTEDRTNIFLEYIKDAPLLKDKVIWMWGFDWLAPKDLAVLEELMQVCELNIVFTWDRDESAEDAALFEITGQMIRRLRDMAGSHRQEYSLSQIDDMKEMCPAVSGIERGLFKLPRAAAAEAELCSARDAVTLVSAASWHSEAETAAAYITGLIRDEGYRYKDIALICNDQTERGEIIRQVFAEYGMDVYIDRRRSILRYPAVAFLVSLMEIAAKGYRTDSIFNMLKTGFGPLSDTETEQLENYAAAYKIKGSKWNRSFEGPMEDLRKRLVDFIAVFNGEYKKERSAASRTEAIYGFLKGCVDMPSKLQERIQSLEAAGKLEEAGETAQLWQSIVDVLVQMITVMGETKVSLETYAMLLTAGLGAVEIGILPPGADGLIMGTMQRSRLSDIKALVILGANEGVIPQIGSGTAILTDREIDDLRNSGREIAKVGSLRRMEEELAMYRILSEPKEKIYMSYSLADSKGAKLRPAEIFNDIKNYYNIEPRLDIVSAGDAMAKIVTPQSTLRHLSQEALSAKAYGRELEPLWQEAYAWCEENAPAETKAMLAGLNYRNHQDRLSKEVIHDVYSSLGGSIRISPSSFEKYVHCPFSFFVQAGLRPQERRLYEVGVREVGDLYHHTLEKVMKVLGSDGLKVMDPASMWQTKTRREIDEMTGKIFDEEAASYRQGLGLSGPEEKYRTGRMKETICDNIWALIMHVRCGRIDSIRLEQGFGDYEGAAFPAVNIDAGSENVKITGKIDRIDVLENGRIKIIDYKSGENKITKEDISSGKKIQLMLYLKAASGEDEKPAGVFYYNIFSKTEKLNKKSLREILEKANDDISRDGLYKSSNYRLEGIIIDEPENIRDIVGDAGCTYPVVNGCEYKSTYKEFRGSAMISEEDFDELRKRFDSVIREYCQKMAGGVIDVDPDKDACKYCEYKSICKNALKYVKI